MLDSTPAWVAVMTHPHAEATVAKHFAEAKPPIECYLPMLINRDHRVRKGSMMEKPMFPNYLFARINNKRIYETRTTHGVIYIVSSNHSIIQVPEREIEAIRRFEATQRKIHIRETSQLVKGARTVILSGEFAGMEGVLVKGDADGNFAVNISVMNLSFVVHIKRSELRPAADDTPKEETSI